MSKPLEDDQAAQLRSLRERLRAIVGVDDGDLQILTDSAQIIEKFDEERQRLNYAIEMAPG